LVLFSSLSTKFLMDVSISFLTLGCWSSKKMKALWKQRNILRPLMEE